MQTIIIGHKNPDMDSICAALAYARLKELLGVPNVIAARAGNTNARIDFVLEKFGVEPPVFMSDVSPRVSDVMRSNVESLRADSSIYEAIQLSAEKQLRGLPVVDDGNRCLGLLSTFKLSHHLFPPREEAPNARKIAASVAGIKEAVEGTVITGTVSDETEDLILIVGAMNAETFSGRLKNQQSRQIVIFVGDREDVQLCAIQAPVQAIVVTGSLPILPAVREAAQAANVTIISSPYDTATSVLLARGAVKAGRMIDAEYLSFTPDTLLESARERAANSPAWVFPIVNEDGTLAGVLSKSDFIKPVPRRLILVDHNELSQAVSGADKVPITEILDHHRLGGMSSDLPIHFWNNPVGSTSTIVAMCYQQMGVTIPPDIAGLLMAG